MAAAPVDEAFGVGCVLQWQYFISEVSAYTSGSVELSAFHKQMLLLIVHVEAAEKIADSAQLRLKGEGPSGVAKHVNED